MNNVNNVFSGKCDNSIELIIKNELGKVLVWAFSDASPLSMLAAAWVSEEDGFKTSIGWYESAHFNGCLRYNKIYDNEYMSRTLVARFKNLSYNSVALSQNHCGFNGYYARSFLIQRLGLGAAGIANGRNYTKELETMKIVKPVEIVSYLMKAHNENQTTLGKANVIGNQGQVSRFLRGKRELNRKDVIALCKHYGINTSVFFKCFD